SGVVFSVEGPSPWRGRRRVMARPTRDQHEKNVCYFWLVYEDWFWTVIMLNSVQAHARKRCCGHEDHGGAFSVEAEKQRRWQRKSRS
ncbi:unnamed protein product, partial [Pylaiella littoralis]